MQSVELLQKNKVEFNVLCVLSQANVGRPKELYKFYRALGIDNLQFIPLAEFDGAGNPCPSPSRPNSTGAFFARSSTSGGPSGARCASACSTTSPKRWPARSPATAPCTRPATAMSWWSTTATCIRATSSSKAGGSSATSTWIPGRRSRAARALQLRLEEDDRAPGVPGLRVSVHLPRRLPQVPPRPARRLRGAGLLLPGVQDDLRQIGRAAARGSKEIDAEPTARTRPAVAPVTAAGTSWKTHSGCS